MGVRIVKRSIALGTPVIYVAMNYRLDFAKNGEFLIFTLAFIITGLQVGNNLATLTIALCLISRYIYQHLDSSVVRKSSKNRSEIWDFGIVSIQRCQ